MKTFLTPPQDSGANDREALLRELFVRLFTYPGDPRVYNPQLLVGQMPEGLSAEIPFPANNRVLGTLIRGPQDSTIVVDTDLPPTQALDFYTLYIQANMDMGGNQPSGGWFSYAPLLSL